MGSIKDNHRGPARAQIKFWYLQHLEQSAAFIRKWAGRLKVELAQSPAPDVHGAKEASTILEDFIVS